MTILTKPQQDLTAKMFNNKALAPFNLIADFDFTNLVHSAVVNICTKNDPEHPLVIIGIDFHKVTSNPYISGVRFDHRYVDMPTNEALYIRKQIKQLDYKYTDM